MLSVTPQPSPLYQSPSHPAYLPALGCSSPLHACTNTRQIPTAPGVCRLLVHAHCNTKNRHIRREIHRSSATPTQREWVILHTHTNTPNSSGLSAPLPKHCSIGSNSCGRHNARSLSTSCHSDTMFTTLQRDRGEKTTTCSRKSRGGRPRWRFIACRAFASPSVAWQFVRQQVKHFVT